MVSYGSVYPIMVWHCNHIFHHYCNSKNNQRPPVIVVPYMCIGRAQTLRDGRPTVFPMLALGSLVILLAFTCLRGENHMLLPQRVAADDDIFDLAENGSAF